MVRQKQTGLQVRLRARRESRPNSVSTSICVICGKAKKLTVAQERRNPEIGPPAIAKSLCSCSADKLKSKSNKVQKCTKQKCIYSNSWLSCPDCTF